MNSHLSLHDSESTSYKNTVAILCGFYNKLHIDVLNVSHIAIFMIAIAIILLLLHTRISRYISTLVNGSKSYWVGSSCIRYLHYIIL